MSSTKEPQCPQSTQYSLKQTFISLVPQSVAQLLYRGFYPASVDLGRIESDVEAVHQVADPCVIYAPDSLELVFDSKNTRGTVKALQINLGLGFLALVG